MPLSDYDFENVLSRSYNEAHNSPTRERVELVRALMKDPRGAKLLKKWSPFAGEQVRQLLDPTLGELIIRIGEAERTRKPEPKQALKSWVSGSRELRAALDRIPVFRDRYKWVTKSIVARKLDPGFERLEKAVAKAFAARMKGKRPTSIGGVFEQESFYLSLDESAPEKVRDAALARAFRDVIDEPVEGADDEAIDALRRLAALVALGRFLRRQKAKRVTLSDDIEMPRRQAKLGKIPLGRSRDLALDALCAKAECKRIFERLLVKGKGELLSAL